MKTQVILLNCQITRFQLYSIILDSTNSFIFEKTRLSYGLPSPNNMDYFWVNTQFALVIWRKFEKHPCKINKLCSNHLKIALF